MILFSIYATSLPIDLRNTACRGIDGNGKDRFTEAEDAGAVSETTLYDVAELHLLPCVVVGSVKGTGKADATLGAEGFHVIVDIRRTVCCGVVDDLICHCLHILIECHNRHHKSYLLKLILTNTRMSGKSVLCLDAEQEYKDLTNNLGGCYVDLMGGQYIINPPKP